MNVPALEDMPAATVKLMLMNVSQTPVETKPFVKRAQLSSHASVKQGFLVKYAKSNLIHAKLGRMTATSNRKVGHVATVCTLAQEHMSAFATKVMTDHTQIKQANPSTIAKT